MTGAAVCDIASTVLASYQRQTALLYFDTLCSAFNLSPKGKMNL